MRISTFFSFLILVASIGIGYYYYSQNSGTAHSKASAPFFSATPPLKYKKSDIEIDYPFVSQENVKIFTKDELKQFSSENEGKIYLAILGEVFDVSTGRSYQKGSSYPFFTGVDGSRAFVTGDFSAKGLIDSLEGLTPSQVASIKDWRDFYHKDYKFVGLLEGEFFDKDGNPRQQVVWVQQQLAKAAEEKRNEQEDKKKFPPCNASWQQGKGSEVWCTNESGGIKRDWDGYPRQRFKQGSTSPACICVKDANDPNPSLRVYENCEPTSKRCKIPPSETKQK